MSELALYRKYRPESFDEMMGQGHVVDALTQSLKSGAPAHAYLLTGPRGTGKTTTARIIARMLETSPNDLYEIDAASNTGVDDIRLLKEAIQTLPFDSKYKVYIIDEVHMLSKSAFNALLKTLEEPPAHVIFVLATTELHKVPDTIISRCQTFSFKKPTQDVLRDLVVETAKKEGYAIDAEAASVLAMLGDGAFRDTYGMLQKVMSSVKAKKITVEDVEHVTGAPRAELVHDLIRAIIAKNIETALLAVRHAVTENIDIITYLKLVMRELRFALLFKFSPVMKKEVFETLSLDEQKFQDEITGAVGVTLNSALLKELIDVYADTGKSHIAELPLELALIKLLSSQK